MIDTSKYDSYSFVPGASGGVVKIYTSEGYIPYSEAETFDISGGLLVCFTADMSSPGVTDLVVFHGDNQSVIQTTAFESVLDTFGLAPNINPNIDTYYAYSNSVEIARLLPTMTGPALIEDTSTRCDYNNFGPGAFYQTESVFEKFHGYRNFLSITGVAHILRLDVEGVNSSNRVNRNQTITVQTRTVGGAVKNLMEWSMISSSPWNNQEPPAIKAAEMIDRLNISQDCLNEVWDLEPYSYLGRYLCGETDYMQHTEESGVLPESLESYLKSVYRYQTLSALVKNHPHPPEIEDSVLAEEKTPIESLLFSFLSKYGFAYEFISPSEMLAMLRSGFMPDAQENRGQAISALERYIAYA